MRVLLTVATAAMLAFGLIAADLAGTWKGTMETQMGATEVTIAFQPGATLAGNVQAGEYEGPIENAKLSGEKVSFVARMGPGTVAFEGTLAGDEMKLDVTGTQGDKYKLICRRQK
jgi:hypothetical protein